MPESSRTKQDNKTLNKTILDSHETALLCARSVIDKKALHTLILDVGQKGSFTDYFVISSGTSERQVQAMADEVLRQMRATGRRPTLEGYDEGRWVLVDLGDVVVHLFHESLREFYSLEDLWAGASRIPIPADFYTAAAVGTPASTSTAKRA